MVDSIGQPRRIPWAEFADGRAWELSSPADFDQDAGHARKAAMAWAYRHGFEPHTSVLAPDRLRVQFLAPR